MLILCSDCATAFDLHEKNAKKIEYVGGRFHFSRGERSYCPTRCALTSAAQPAPKSFPVSARWQECADLRRLLSLECEAALAAIAAVNLLTTAGPKLQKSAEKRE